MDIIQKIMSLIDDNKEKFQENTYLEMCNLMKNVYTKDDNSDNEELHYVRIKYRDDLYDIIKKDKNAKPLFENIVIVYSDETEELIHAVQCMVQSMIFDKLSCKSLMTIISRFGGKKKGYKKMKKYIKDVYDRYLIVYHDKPRRDQYDIMAYHIIDHLVYDYVYDTDFTEDNTVNIVDLYKICKHMYDQ